MNPAKCDALDYIHFLVAAQTSFSCTEAARCQPAQEGAPARDALYPSAATTASRHCGAVAGDPGADIAGRWRFGLG